MALFNHSVSQPYKLHGGAKSHFLIDCGTRQLFESDWDALAWLYTRHYEFGRVVPIPRGGCAFAAALQRYAQPRLAKAVIVDDVLTTGDSFRMMKEEIEGPSIGVCAFDRSGGSNRPDWVTAMFVMGVPDDLMKREEAWDAEAE